MNFKITGLALFISVASAAPVHAELVDRGNGMLYDTVQNITWLQDANYAKTEFANNPNRIAEIIAAVGSVDGHVLTEGDFNATTGRMSWWGALAWADQLAYGGFDDWRLPNMVQPDASCEAHSGDFSYGYGCQSNEMGYLFYNYLNDPALGLAAYGVKKVGSQVTLNGITIQNIQPHHWTSETSFVDANSAFFFPFNGQGLGTNGKWALGVIGAWAVRDGDVLPPPPPVTAVNITHAKWKRGFNKLAIVGSVTFDPSLTEDKKLALIAEKKLTVRDALNKAVLSDSVIVAADGTWKVTLFATQRKVACQVEASFADQSSSAITVSNTPARCRNRSHGRGD